MTNQSMKERALPIIPDLSDFTRHFKDHYEKRIEKHLANVKKRKYFHPIWPLLVLILLLIVNQFIVQILIVSQIIMPALFICYVLFNFISARLKRLSPDLGKKDILSFFLLKASESFEAYNSEKKTGNTKRATKFLDETLMFIQKFGYLLKGILDDSEMPLSLPDIEQLDKLQENVMNRIYPMIQEGRNIDNILLTLSRFFFYEKEYDQLPGINQLIENNLPSKPFEEREGIRELLVGQIKRSFLVIMFIILGLVIVAVLVGIYLLRAPTYGIVNYWTYISDNAATILLGMLALWATLVFAIRQKYGKKE